MNSSLSSKDNESLTIKSNSLRQQLKINQNLNKNFLSIATYTNTDTFTNKPKYDISQYRKTISYLRTPYIVDLMKQSNLTEHKVMRFNKNYLVNLIKIKMEKNKSKLPNIKTLSTFSPKTGTNFRTFSIDFNNRKNDTYKLHQTFNDSIRNRNKEKINELYKKIYNNKNHLKNVYVNQFMNNDKNGDEKELINISIKPKINNNSNKNFIISQKKFMKYHGFNKRKKINVKSIIFDKKKDKYQNIGNIRIWQLFLKKKLKILNKNVKIAKDEFELAKNNLISVYDSFNQKIQKNIEDVYGTEGI